MRWLGVAAIGLLVGFLSGLFGKGGSAIATPLLHALGVPAIVAVAAPLPATIPSTLVAGAASWRGHPFGGEGRGCGAAPPGPSTRARGPRAPRGDRGGLL